MPEKWTTFSAPASARISEKLEAIGEQMRAEIGFNVPQYAVLDRLITAEFERRGLKLVDKPRRGRPPKNQEAKS